MGGIEFMIAGGGKLLNQRLRTVLFDLVAESHGA
jgi:hypothetical protein